MDVMDAYHVGFEQVNAGWVGEININIKRHMILVDGTGIMKALKNYISYLPRYKIFWFFFWNFSGKHNSNLYRVDVDFTIYCQSFVGFNTAKNTVFSPNFLVWKLCWKEQLLHSFRWISKNCTETAPFHKISTPGIRWNHGIFHSVKSSWVYPP